MRHALALIPDALVLAGACCALAGLLLLAGVGWTLLVGGLALLALGVLAELRG